MSPAQRYVNETGEVLVAPAGSELDKVLAQDPEWTLVGKRRPEAAQASSETPDGGTPDGGTPEDLGALKRDQLNELAASLGIEDPASLSSKADVVAAIEAAQASSE